MVHSRLLLTTNRKLDVGFECPCMTLNDRNAHLTHYVFSSLYVMSSGACYVYTVRHNYRTP